MTDLQDADPWQDPAFRVPDAPEMREVRSRTSRGTGGTAGRGRRKPAIIRAGDPLTRESLPEIAIDEEDSDESGHQETAGAEAAELQSLWDHGALESAQFAAKLGAVARYWPQGPDPEHDLRDEAEYRVAQALRTTINHASRLLGDARRATAHLPRLLDLMASGQLPARWFTFVLRRTTELCEEKLTDLDASVAGWDLRVEEERFSRRLSALVRWLRDQQEAAAPSPPQRSVEVFPPDDDGIACLQVHGPAPEILALGRRLDSAAKAVQQAQRRALAHGEEVPFDDGTATQRGTASSLARLRYEILTRSVLDTGSIEVPRERFRIGVTVPVLTLLGVENGPGLLDGIHPIPADMARRLAGQETTWHRVLTDPAQGAFLPLPATTYTPTREMLEYLRLANPVCAVPGCNRPTSWASQMDHIEEYDHRDPVNGGRTEILNLHPLCWRHHQMKTAGLLDPTKESITHPATTTQKRTGPPTTPSSRSDLEKRPERPPPDGESPDHLSPRSSPPDESSPESTFHGRSPGKDIITGCDPGVTHWSIRGGPPRRVEDECDLITPWIVESFTTRWDQTQQRLAAHRAAADGPAADDDPAAADGPATDDGSTAGPKDPGPPPF